MKRLVQVTVQAVIEVESEDEVKEVVDDIVKLADWDIDSYVLRDCGVLEDDSN